MTYEFKTIEEFVLYLDTRAKDFRSKAARCHPRTHDNARYVAAASEIESVATIVRLSNITVLSRADLKRIAANG